MLPSDFVFEFSKSTDAEGFEIPVKAARAACSEFDFKFADPKPSIYPRLSVVIPFRGRIPHVSACVRNLSAQVYRDFEIILSEESAAPVKTFSFPGVRKIHTKGGPLFNKARAINAGVRAARAGIVVIHDVDILVPDVYLSEADTVLSENDSCACNILRNVIYLDRKTTDRVVESNSFDGDVNANRVRKKCWGGSIVVDKKAFLELRGADETYEGYGWEDTDLVVKFHVSLIGAFVKEDTVDCFHLNHEHFESEQETRRNHLIREKQEVENRRRFDEKWSLVSRSCFESIPAVLYGSSQGA